MTPIERLKAVLCDPLNRVSIVGSEADHEEIDAALKELEFLEAKQAEVLGRKERYITVLQQRNSLLCQEKNQWRKERQELRGRLSGAEAMLERANLRPDEVITLKKSLSRVSHQLEEAESALAECTSARLLAEERAEALQIRVSSLEDELAGVANKDAIIDGLRADRAALSRRMTEVDAALAEETANAERLLNERNTLEQKYQRQFRDAKLLRTALGEMTWSRGNAVSRYIAAVEALRLERGKNKSLRDEMLARVQGLEQMLADLRDAKANAERANEEAQAALASARAVIEEAEGALGVFDQEFVRYGALAYATKALSRIREWKEATE